MKVKKIDKRIINSILLISIVFMNLILIYKPLEEKEERLLNQVKVINMLQEDKLKDKAVKNDSKDLIINIESYFKDVSLVKYIKSDNNDKNFTDIEVYLTGDKNLVVEKLINIDKLNKNIFLEGMKIEKVDGNNIDCSLKLNVY